MNFEQWIETYKPLVNHLDQNASFQDEHGVGIMFETYGDELQHVKQQDNRNIWTLVDGEDDNLIICSGFWLCNRIGYFITEKPSDDEHLEIEID